ncbi:MAG: AraC family transcriptional regulator [Clostridia bacterium]|nr:AraC family transcriptional regulator [Clostridia bacterium]
MRKLDENHIIDEGLEMKLFFRETDKSTPAHTLGFYKLTAVFAGSGSFAVGDKEYPIKDGSVFAVAPDVPHMMMLTGAVSYCDITIRTGFFEEPRIKNWLEEVFGTSDARDAIPAAAYFDRFSAEKLRSGLGDMEKEQIYRQKFFAEKMRLELLSLLLSLARSSGTPQGAVTKKAPMPVIKDYINANISKRLTLAQVAKAYNYSPSYLSRLFSESEKTSFTRYVRDQRLENARRLLRDSSWPTGEIASMCGCTNKTLFYRFFREKFGVTPAQYRKLNKPKY